MANNGSPARLADRATAFLAPILYDLATEHARSRSRLLPPLGLAARTRLLDAPASVAPMLMELIERTATRGITRREDIARAVQILGALGAHGSLPVLFDLAVRCAEDPAAIRERGSPVFGALGQAFADLGPSIVTPLVPFLGGNERDVGLLLVLVAEAGVADDRLLTMFIEALEQHPCDAASALLLLGDQRALTPLYRRLARIPSDGTDDGWCRDILSLTHAIEELGGRLDARDRQRADEALELHRVFYAAQAAAVNARDRTSRDGHCGCTGGAP